MLYKTNTRSSLRVSVDDVEMHGWNWCREDNKRLKDGLIKTAGAACSGRRGALEVITSYKERVGSDIRHPCPQRAVSLLEFDINLTIYELAPVY